MNAFAKIANRTSTVCLMGTLTVAAFGTITTLAAPAHPDACQDRLVKIGDLDKDQILDKDTGLFAKNDGTDMNKSEGLGTKEDGTPMEKEYDLNKEYDLGTNGF